MKADAFAQFKEEIGKEVDSFKKNIMFGLMPIENKPKDKTVISFVWSFKHKRDPMGELIKHKVIICVHGGKQVKCIDHWNTYAPIVNATTTRLILILYQINKWKCRHLDYILFSCRERNGYDVSDQCYLKLLKNYYGTKDAAANWFAVLQKSLE